MPVVEKEFRASGELGWHDCSATSGKCLVCQIEQALGEGVWDSILTFIAYSESGAVLNLESDGNGFKLQITRAVQSTDDSVTDLDGCQPFSQEPARFDQPTQTNVPLPQPDC